MIQTIGEITFKASCTWRKSGKTVGVLEIQINGYGRKYVDLVEFKEKSGVTKLSQNKKINEWLNTDEGKTWAVATPHKPIS